MPSLHQPYLLQILLIPDMYNSDFLKVLRYDACNDCWLELEFFLREFYFLAHRHIRISANLCNLPESIKGSLPTIEELERTGTEPGRRKYNLIFLPDFRTSDRVKGF